MKRHQFQKLFYRMRKRELVNNILTVFFGDFASKGMACVATILIIRTLSIEDYAKFTAFSTIMFLFPALIGGGINMGMVRFSSEHFSNTGQRHVNLYLTSMIMQILVYLLVGIVLWFFRDTVCGLLFGGKSYETALIYGLVGGIGYLVLRCGASVYQAEEKFNQYVCFNWTVQGIKSLALICFIVFLTLNFTTASFAIIGANIFVSILIITFVFKSHNVCLILYSIKNNITELSEFLHTSGWLVAYFLALTAFQRLDIFMLSNLSTGAELAIYGVSYQYYTLVLMVLGSIQTVLLPKFSRVEMADRGVQLDFVFKWLKYTWWVVIPIALVDLFGKPVFVWVNGLQYEQSFYIFILFSLGIWESLMFSPLVNVLIARKDYIALFLIAVGAFILNYFGNYMFVPRWGALAAASITILSVGFVGIMIFARILLCKNRVCT